MKSNYAYISTKIKVLEKSLPDATDIERMIDAPNFASAFKVFNDTDYADNLIDVEPHDYYKALADDLKQLKDFIVKSAPDKKLVEFLLLKEDFNNVKVIIKTFPPKADQPRAEKHENIKTHGEAELSPLGNIEPKNLIKVILENKKISGNDLMAEAITRIMAQIKPETPAWEIDAIVDRAYFETASILAKKLKNKTLNNFLKSQIDTANLKIILRVKHLNKDKNFISKNLIANGNFSTAELAKLVNQPTEKIISQLTKHFDREAQTEFSKLLGTGKFSNLDLIVNKFQNRQLKKVASVTYGPEIMFAYFYDKMNALKNIRLIMIGKLNNLTSDEVKERVII